jgi:hypothetical protein
MRDPSLVVLMLEAVWGVTADLEKLKMVVEVCPKGKICAYTLLALRARL